MIEEVKLAKDIYTTPAGDSYQVMTSAKHSENGKTMIVCRNTKEPQRHWIIPIANFPEVLNQLNAKEHPNNDYDSIMGKYRHFKNKEYATICVAVDTETNEELMVYRALYGNFDVWARPLSMFLGYKNENGKEIKRFTKIE